MGNMTLRQALEHLRAAAERNGALDVVGWCSVALAAGRETHEEILETAGRPIIGRWRIGPSNAGGWQHVRGGRAPHKVYATFPSEQQARRIADALNAIEYERQLKSEVRGG